MSVSPPRFRFRRQDRGVALVIVLSCVAVLTVLVVAFLLAAQVEKRSAVSFQASATTQKLADTAVNIVEAEITTATAATGGPNGTSWASQPGAIWTFNSTSTTGPANIYRLYSWNPETTTIPSDVVTGDVGKMTSWNTSPAVWVDLNAPSVSSSGTNYPIVDPTLAKTIDGFNPNNPVASTTAPAQTTGTSEPMPVQWLYVLQNGQVVSPTPATSGTVTVVTVAGASVSNPIVGRIGYWTDDETCKVNVNTAGGDDTHSFFLSTTGSGSYATSYSPTATATFWDTPHFNSTDDAGVFGNISQPGFANSQPANGEFQRYPGHPATVALNYILSSLTGAIAGSNQTMDSQSFYSLTPRYQYGGSAGGTVSLQSVGYETTIPLKTDRLYASTEEMLFSSTTRSTSALATAPVTVLSGSALSRVMAKGRFFLTAHSTAPELNLFGLPRISMWPVYNTGSPASLTAASPFLTGTYNTTVYDHLLSFCSTLIASGSAYPYYFTRANNVSISGSANTTNEADANGGRGTPLPPDVSIQRNKDLLNYLDYLTSQTIPGFGGNFLAKYPAPSGGPAGYTGSRQILTEIFDYIRSINSLDPTLPAGQTTPANGNYNGYPSNDFASGTPSSGNLEGNQSSYNSTTKATYGSGGLGGVAVGMGQISPAAYPAWNTQGLGVFPRLAEVDLQFVCLGESGTSPSSLWEVPGCQVEATTYSGGHAAVGLISDTTNGYSSFCYALTGTNNLKSCIVSGTQGQNVAVQAFLLFNFVVPAQAFPWTTYNPVFFVSASGLRPMSIAGTSLNMGLGPLGTGTAVGAACKATSLTNGGCGETGYLDFRSMVTQRTLYPNAGTWAQYPFYSDIVTIPNTSTMSFSGATFTVTVSAPNTLDYAGNVTPYNNTSYPTPSVGDALQTYTITFPTSTFPVPTLALSGTGPRSLGATYSASGTSTSDGCAVQTYDRWNDVTAVGGAMLTGGFSPDVIAQQDVVQGMVLSSSFSDARLLAISGTLPAGVFTAAPGYGTSNIADGVNNIPAMATGTNPTGVLVNGIAYQTHTYPLVPPEMTTGVSGGFGASTFTPGDWDNGVASYPDGPYINKTDEGNAASAVEAALATTVPYFQWNKFYTSGTYFSPNRQVPSPVMLGSLPTGIDPTLANPRGWQSLLFRPGPSSHPGNGISSSGVGPPYSTPPDHLFLDLFWMPVTDPYAISEGFSTAGKINLNYEIVPFTYITRSTAIRAVLAGEMVAQVASSAAATYKSAGSLLNTYGSNARFPIKVGNDSTDDGNMLSQFRDRFAGTGGFALNGTPTIFRSASQICDLYLKPNSAAIVTNWTTPAIAQAAWYSNFFSLVGNNVRDRPYADIYGKVTTKSNTYKVFYTVQSLKPRQIDLVNGQWSESYGTVTAQYRGSATIERYIDPTNSSIVDYAQTGGASYGAASLESAYRWHTLDNHQFLP